MLNSADDIVSCPDQAGAAVGLPDIGAVVGTIEGLSSASGVPGELRRRSSATRSSSIRPQSYQGTLPLGAWRSTWRDRRCRRAWPPRRNGVSTDTKHREPLRTADHRRARPSPQGATRSVGQSARRAPQSGGYRDRDEGHTASSSGFGGAHPWQDASRRRSEAKLQGLSDDQVTWVVPRGVTTSPCRDRRHDGRRPHVMNFLPFEEARTNAMLANFLKYVGTGQGEFRSSAGHALWPAAVVDEVGEDEDHGIVSCRVPSARNPHCIRRRGCTARTTWRRRSRVPA